MEISAAPLMALLGVWLLNAVWPLVGQSGLRFYSPYAFIEAAFVIGFVVLLPSALRKGQWKDILSRNLLPDFFIIGFFFGVPTFLYMAALNYTAPSSAAVVAEIEVLYSMILSAWLLREAISARQVAASLLVVSGAALILAHDAGSGKWKGDLMVAASAWMYQVSHVRVKRLPHRLEASAITRGRVFFQGAIFLIPVCLWFKLKPASLSWSWSYPALGLLFVEGAAIIALSGSLWYAAIRAMDLAKSTAFLLSYPALTMLLSWAMGRESVSPLQIGGLAMTLTGAVWLSLLMAAHKRSQAGNFSAPSLV